MPKLGSRKNYGWGSRLIYAGKNAVHDYYGKGKFGTRASHINRWVVFCRFLKDSGIHDAKEINNETLEDFAEALRERVENGDMKISYAVNLISSCNVTLRAMRGDNLLWIRPVEHVGPRSRVRTIVPKGMDKSLVKQAAENLKEKGAANEAIVLQICRGLGTRKKEACLIDAHQALDQALKSGKVNITRGTKGGRGRTKERWVKVTEDIVETLSEAAMIQGTNTSLIPKEMNLKKFFSKVNREWMSVRDSYGLATIQDLRASFACHLYHQITGYPAPVIHGKRVAPPELDILARSTIAYTLGHNREESASAYVGTRRS